MKSRILSSAFAVSAVISALALPASAQVGVNASANASVNAPAATINNNSKSSGNSSAKNSSSAAKASSTSQDKLDKRVNTLSDRGDVEINNRINSLTKLAVRIQDMKNLSASQKASFTANIQTQIAAMNTLLAKIQADTSTTSLKADLQTIAPNYRIYRLIMPQLSIVAAADRADAAVATLQTLGAKFDARLAEHASTSMSARLADFKAKIADASIQSKAAVSLVMSLQPDQGVQAVMTANDAALKAGREKIHTAMKDLQTAYSDAKAIAQYLKAEAKVSATTSASTTVR
ncbi:MAG: hypothetical protein JWO00_686 [Candidatus Parcubacteria bacterium]|nr:hypothetical protein [Candidatus Parcubacteria bacterium]